MADAAGTKRPADDAGPADGSAAKAAKTGETDGDATECTVKLEPCIVCREKRYYPVSFAPCGHVLCDACATTVFENEPRECHLCRREVVAVVPNLPLAAALGFKLISDRASAPPPGPTMEFVENGLYLVLKKGTPVSTLSIVVAKKEHNSEKMLLQFLRFGFLYEPSENYALTSNATFYVLFVVPVHIFAYIPTISVPNKIECTNDYKAKGYTGFGIHGDRLFFNVQKEDEVDVLICRTPQNACIRLYSEKRNMLHVVQLPGKDARIDD